MDNMGPVTHITRSAPLRHALCVTKIHVVAWNIWCATGNLGGKIFKKNQIFEFTRSGPPNALHIHIYGALRGNSRQNFQKVGNFSEKFKYAGFF
jgi:hypothetical protein